MVRTILKPDAPIPKVLDVEIWDKAIPQPMVRHPMHCSSVAFEFVRSADSVETLTP